MAFGTAEGNTIIDGWNSHYVSLHTGDPGATGASEVAGGSYARQQVTLSAAANKASANTGALNFTGMPAVTITHVGIWTLESGGAFEIGGALAVQKTTNAGDTFQLPVGDLDVALT
jgi:hypothetical protein